MKEESSGNGKSGSTGLHSWQILQNRQRSCAGAYK
uniref:Uncharacterized protein n=1 Tax=Manihot esculenta TaxID=3983 RepID=A0A2C9UI80_MANES